MSNTSTPGAVASSEGLGLVQCPLCGAATGYTIEEGATYRWRRVCCESCGREVEEVRSGGNAADAWNHAGAHAQGLRDKIARLTALLGTQKASYELEIALEVAAERDRLRALVQAVRDSNAAEQWAPRMLTARQEAAWIALMAGLDGPNVRANRPSGAAQE